MIDKTSENNSVSDLSTNDKSIRNLGMLIVFATFGIFGLWAVFAPIDSSALAPGVLVVKAYKKPYNILMVVLSQKSSLKTVILLKKASHSLYWMMRKLNHN